MSCMDGLTPEQRAFALHGHGAFVEACPGAGKTRTVIARLCNIASSILPRRGVAVLSFTNTAVDEFRSRCRKEGLDALLRHPSYMGTLDAFVRHFVVLPTQSADVTVRPIILDSWDSLDVGIRLAGNDAFRGDAVPLDLFDAESGSIDPQRIGHSGLRAHVRLHQARYEEVASRKRHALLRAGYMSADDARVQVMRVLQDQEIGGSLGRALAARFHEVMVDEGQDCNPLDLQILGWLREHGVQVTFVCDPGQAIYEFRRGDHAGLMRFKDTFPADSQLSLTGNFRSSRAICGLSSTLRSELRIDEALGEAADTPHPVMLFVYPGQAVEMVGSAFASWLAELGEAPDDAIVLAHAGNVAQRATGGKSSAEPTGSSRVEQIARTVAGFWSPAATARSRDEAIQRIETLLLDLMGIRKSGEHLLRAIERNGTNRRELRRLALTLLTSLPRQCEDRDASRVAWIAELVAQTQKLRLALPQGVTLRGFFRTPTNGRWVKHLASSSETGLACATIHQAKGREYGAVCVVLPPDRAPSTRTRDLLNSWEQRTESEAKRVIYVGVTRAKVATAIAAPQVFADQVAAILRANAVALERRGVGERE